VLLIHGTQDADTQVPLAIGIFVRNYSELSDAEQVFLYAGDSCPEGIAARLGELQSILSKNTLRRLSSRTMH
jgi:hypothetical protein